MTPADRHIRELAMALKLPPVTEEFLCELERIVGLRDPLSTVRPDDGSELA